MYPAPGIPCIPPEPEPEALPEPLFEPDPLPLVAPLEELWPLLAPELPEPPEPPLPLELPLPVELPPLAPPDPLPPGLSDHEDAASEHAVKSRQTRPYRTNESPPDASPLGMHPITPCASAMRVPLEMAVLQCAPGLM
jgi:hypothetical protein